MKSLFLVAGHAIPRRFDALESDEGWFLKHFQAGEARLYVEHVRRGVLLASAHPDSILLFAGGQTDSQAGPRSEGQGYWLVGTTTIGSAILRSFRVLAPKSSRWTLLKIFFSVCADSRN